MLYVVRHGKTDWNNKKITMGKKDIPLNEQGLEDAKKLKKKLISHHIDLIICSPLTRTKETANIINEDRHVQIEYEKRIEERGFGLLEGKEYPKDNERLWNLRETAYDYEIETMENFKKRVYEFLDEITIKYSDKDILLVTHGGVSALIDCYFINISKEESLSNRFLNNGSLASYNIKSKKNIKILKNN